MKGVPDLNVVLPLDVRYAPAVAAMAVHAAGAVGCADAAADAFGLRVQQVVHECVALDAARPGLPVTVRQLARAVEVIVDGQTLRLDV